MPLPLNLRGGVRGRVKIENHEKHRVPQRKSFKLI